MTLSHSEKFPGGAREVGETPVDCVQRETREELGVRVPEERLEWRGCWVSSPSHIWFFVCEWPDFDPGRIRFGDEGERFALAPINWYLTRAACIPSQKMRLAAYLRYRHRL